MGGTGNRERGTGNREQGTGNRERGTGNWESRPHFFPRNSQTAGGGFPVWRAVAKPRGAKVVVADIDQNRLGESLKAGVSAAVNLRDEGAADRVARLAAVDFVE
ncbi:MAG: hypothetical protein ILM98_07295 [Kiritimatiellae bacterium]|nr:hypothetical protein [Kiritimatiellia bacterium]